MDILTPAGNPFMSLSSRRSRPSHRPAPFGRAERPPTRRENQTARSSSIPRSRTAPLASPDGEAAPPQCRSAPGGRNLSRGFVPPRPEAGWGDRTSRRLGRGGQRAKRTHEPPFGTARLASLDGEAAPPNVASLRGERAGGPTVREPQILCPPATPQRRVGGTRRAQPGEGGGPKFWARSVNRRAGSSGGRYLRDRPPRPGSRRDHRPTDSPPPRT
jgi:hypothetical protein